MIEVMESIPMHEIDFQIRMTMIVWNADIVQSQYCALMLGPDSYHVLTLMN